MTCKPLKDDRPVQPLDSPVTNPPPPPPPPPSDNPDEPPPTGRKRT